MSKQILISVKPKYVAEILNEEEIQECAFNYLVYRLERIWQGMKQRCLNKNNPRFYTYGAKGIRVCDEWLVKENFIKWGLLNGYKPDLSIERIDINKDYSPKNCKWIQLKEQSKNKSDTHLITHNGKTQCLEDWCRELGLKSNTILYRVKMRNISFEEALFNYKPYTKNDKKYCPKGHEYTKENTGYTSQGYRYCKTCRELKRPIYNAHRREQRRLSKNG